MSDLFSQSSLLNSGTGIVSLTEEKQFLRFHLNPDAKVMLPIRQITEVLKIQFGQIVPIPQMPPWVMGVYNWRGDILWMLDLGHLIGLNSWYQQEINRSNYTTIVLSPDKEKTKTNSPSNINLGLVISRIEDIETCDIDAIQSPLSSMVTAQLMKFLRGYWLNSEGDMILVLDGQAIVDVMPKSSGN